MFAHNVGKVLSPSFFLQFFGRPKAKFGRLAAKHSHSFDVNHSVVLFIIVIASFFSVGKLQSVVLCM